MDTLLLKKLNKPNLISGGVVNPSQITTGIIQLETMGSGGKEPVVVGGGVVNSGSSGGGSGGNTGGSTETPWVQTSSWQKDGVTWSINNTSYIICSDEYFKYMWQNGYNGVRTLGNYYNASQASYPKWIVNSSTAFSENLEIVVTLPRETSVSKVEAGYWKSSATSDLRVYMALYDEAGNETGIVQLADGINAINKSARVKTIKFYATSNDKNFAIKSYIYTLIITTA